MTGSLTIRTTSSGKQYYYINLRYKDPETGEWRQKTVKTGLSVKNNKKKALAMIPEFIQKYSYLEDPYDAATEINPNITLCEYLDLWLEQKKTEVRLPTYESYESQVNRMKEYYSAKNPRVAEYTPRMADIFFRFMLANGKIDRKTNNFAFLTKDENDSQEDEEDYSLSAKTVRSYKNILLNVFKQAIVDGLVTQNPISDIVIHGNANKTNNDYIFLTKEESQELMGFLADNFPELLEIVYFGLYYGLRRSEVLGLKWDAIDWKKNIIHIRHTVVRNKTICYTDQTKTEGSRRDLKLFASAEKCLKKIRKQQREDQKFFGNEYHDSGGYIFCWPDGRPYDPDYVTKRFRKAMMEFGRPEITFHKLRHTCASILIEKGWDPKKVQYWLGHEDIKTTLNIYAHYDRHKKQ